MDETVTKKVKQKVYDISGRGGLSPTFQGDRYRAQSDPHLRYLGGDNQMVEGFFNPFIRDGYLSPSNQSYKRITVSGTDSSYGGVPRVFLYSEVKSTDPEITYLLSGNKLLQSSGDDFTTFVSDATTINDETQFYPQDIVDYHLNGDVAHPFFLTEFPSQSDSLMYYDVTDPTTPYTTAYQSTMGLDDYSQLVLADNGYLYVIAQHMVHKYDGSTAGGASGTFTEDVLLFPEEIRLRGGIDYRGNMYIGLVGYEHQTLLDQSYREHEITISTAPRMVGVYVWDRLSTIVKMRDFFVLPNMQNIVGFHISPGGMLRVFGITNHRTVQLLEFNGKGFNIVLELGGRSYPSQPKGVKVSGLITYWLGQDGIFYAFGKVNFTDKAEILAKLLDVNAVAAAISGTSTDVMTKAGAILVTGYYNTGQVTTSNRLDHEAVLIGFQRTGGTNEVIRYFPHTTEILQSVTPVANQGNTYTKVDYFPSLANLKHLHLYCAPGGSDGSTTEVATIKLYANQSTTAFKTITVTRGDVFKGYISVELNKLFVNALQVEIEWETTQQLGTNDFCPNFAVVDYEDTLTLK